MAVRDKRYARILLTGFAPFGRWSVNPSQLVVEEIARRHPREAWLATEVLPTEYVAAGRRLIELIALERPDVVLSLGLGGGSDMLRLEQVALNLDDAELADNAGQELKGQFIVADGPAAYWSTLPLQDLFATLSARSIPVRYSNNAGGFICNHVFYLARHTIEQSGLAARAGFIHVPEIAATPGAAGLPFETMVDAVEICLAVIRGEPLDSESEGLREVQHER